MTRTLWDSTVGKKTVMAVSGLIMLLYLVVHMMGNLKIFFGPGQFNAYAHWLRTIGEPFLHYEWALWLIRVVLVAAVVAHAVCAYQLSRRDMQGAARASTSTSGPGASYATRTMRWGGVILALFIVWHILDLTTGTVHPRLPARPPLPERRGHLLHLVRERHLHRGDGRARRCTSSTASGARPRPSARATPRRDRALKALANVLAAGAVRRIRLRTRRRHDRSGELT